MNTKLVVVAGVGLAVLAGLGIFVLQRARTPHEVVVAPPAPIANSIASVGPPASCLLPGPPPVAPDGVRASEADMKLGHDVMQSFVQHLEAYQACRNAQADHAGAGVSQTQKDAWIAQGNEAIDEANALAASFSAQLKVFKARVSGR